MDAQLFLQEAWSIPRLHCEKWIISVLVLWDHSKLIWNFYILPSFNILTLSVNQGFISSYISPTLKIFLSHLYELSPLQVARRKIKVSLKLFCIFFTKSHVIWSTKQSTSSNISDFKNLSPFRKPGSFNAKHWL